MFSYLYGFFFQIILGIVKFVIVVSGGTILGLVCGLLSSYITKFTNSVKGLSCDCFIFPLMTTSEVLNY